MEWKKIIKFLETKYWKMALDKYLDEKKNWVGCKEREKQCQGCGGKEIEKKKIEKKKIKEVIRK